MTILAILLTFAVLLQNAGGHTIAGRVLNANGQVPSGVGLSVCHRDSDSSACQPVPLRADGLFTTGPLPPRTYALKVGPAPSLPDTADVDGALAIVDVGTADVAGVSITTRRYRLRGKYVMRTENPAAVWPSSIHVTPLLVAGGAPDMPTISEGAPNGEFILHNVFGPRVLRPGYGLASGSRWWFTQILLDGVDVTDIATDFSARPDAKLEVVFTQHPARIDGVVTNAAGQPVPGAWVLLLSTNPALWRSSTVSKLESGRDGRFSFATRPAPHLLVALAPTPYQVRPNLSELPALAARATSVSVGDRERVELRLQLPR